MQLAYKILCWLVGGAFVLFGLGLIGLFGISITPGSSSPLPFPIGPQGYYFVAFSGSCLVAWGLCLFGAARGHGGRAIGSAMAIGLLLAASTRLVVWLFGDVWWMRGVPRLESIGLLTLALVFVWLRPPSTRRADA